MIRMSGDDYLLTCLDEDVLEINETKNKVSSTSVILL